MLSSEGRTLMVFLCDHFVGRLGSIPAMGVLQGEERFGQKYWSVRQRVEVYITALVVLSSQSPGLYTLPPPSPTLEIIPQTTSDVRSIADRSLRTPST